MDWLQVISDWIRVDPTVRIPVIAAGVAILAAALGSIGQYFGFFHWLIGLFRKPPITDAEGTARSLADKSEELGALKQREKDRSTIEDRESTIRELTAMIESLVQQRQQPDAPSGIDAASTTRTLGRSTASATSASRNRVSSKRYRSSHCRTATSWSVRRLSEGHIPFWHISGKI